MLKKIVKKILNAIRSFESRITIYEDKVVVNGKVITDENEKKKVKAQMKILVDEMQTKMDIMEKKMDEEFKKAF